MMISGENAVMDCLGHEVQHRCSHDSLLLANIAGGSSEDE
jgi:hypothetical protein